MKREKTKQNVKILIIEQILNEKNERKVIVNKISFKIQKLGDWVGVRWAYCCEVSVEFLSSSKYQ